MVTIQPNNRGEAALWFKSNKFNMLRVLLVTSPKVVVNILEM